MPDRAQVEQFLANFKEAANSDGGWYLAKRNLDALAQLGVTETIAKSEVMSLEARNYCEGPIGDDNRLERGNVFVFGKDIDGTEIYIKLKIAYIGDTRLAKCLSFHAAERRLDYPFAEGGAT